jgi:hypothetical protein
MRRITQQRAEIELQSHEHQARQRRRCTTEHDQEVIPLVGSIGLHAEQGGQDGTTAAPYMPI